jgi:hypothetical protein
MANSALVNFKKPWGIINQNLIAGNYILTIGNNYDMNKYNGKKNIILTNVGRFGGKNNFISLSLLLFSLIIFGICGIFLIKFKNL